MKLLYTKRSPYARKVRIMALEKGLKLDLIEEDLTKKSNDLIQANPLGKIPTLILDNGEIIVDSPVIAEYLDSLNDKPVLIPRSGADRFKILHLSALVDGLMDVTIAVYMEKIRHPKDFNEAFVKAQEETIARSLKFFEGQLGELNKLSLFSVAVASAIGYLNFRVPLLWTKDKLPKLAAWYEQFSNRPSMQATQPG